MFTLELVPADEGLVTALPFMINTVQVIFFIDEKADGGFVLSSADMPYRLEFSTTQQAREAAMGIAIGRPTLFVTRDTTGKVIGSLNVPAIPKK